MSKKTRVLLLSILNIIFILITLSSVMIYSSLFERLPWFDPDGMQFLFIPVISFPSLFVIFCFKYLLCSYIGISKKLKFLPIISSFGFLLPVLIDDELGIIMQVTGVLIGILTLLVTFRFAIDEIKETLK